MGCAAWEYVEGVGVGLLAGIGNSEQETRNSNEEIRNSENAAEKWRHIRGNLPDEQAPRKNSDISVPDNKVRHGPRMQPAHPIATKAPAPRDTKPTNYTLKTLNTVDST